MQEDQTLVLQVSDFVALLNQTLEFAYPSVTVTGELSNFRVSKGKWVYFDLKDEFASVRCFGTVYVLPGPLEDGMLLNLRAVPRLHPQFGFSLNLSAIQPAGEGSIRRASELLAAKLTAEGLFAEERKRLLPYPPARIGLITSGESAAYADFMKILNVRWGGVEILHADVQVQGEVAPGQIVAAIEQLNSLAEPPDVLVITRGGGSAEDLQAFSTESVTRAVAASRVPTLVAIGHEVDLSLAELAADQRASTPSNAAELLVPDRNAMLQKLADVQELLGQEMAELLEAEQQILLAHQQLLGQNIEQILKHASLHLTAKTQLLEVLSPRAILQRGYAVVRKGKVVVHSTKELKKDDAVAVQLYDGIIDATVQ